MAYWETLASYAVIISFLIAGFAIGFGRALNNKGIEQFGLEEFAQAFINAALLGALLTISTTADTVAQDLMTDINTSMTGTAIDNAITLTQHRIDEVNNFTADLAKIGVTLAYYRSVDITLNNISLQPCAGFQGLENTFHTTLLITSLTQLLSFFPLLLLTFTSSFLFATLLAFALFLRAFFITRKIGSFFIALFLGLYFIYPLLIIATPFALSNSSTNNLLNINLPPTPTQIENNGTIYEIMYNMSFVWDNGAFFTTLQDVREEVIANAARTLFSLVLLPYSFFIVVLWFAKELASTLSFNTVVIAV
jgi:hypothetical protein